MKLEHFALQVPDPAPMARWYVEHLGLTVKAASSDPPHGHFLADDGGTVMLELYAFPEVPMPHYPSQDPRELHVAFVSADPEADVRRLVAAGAMRVSGPEQTPKGDTVAMLRDPWGVCVQLVKRATPMLGG